MRKIEKIKLKINTEINTGELTKGLKNWLETTAGNLLDDEARLLSFHDDGLVWGKIAGGKLLTSDVLKDKDGKYFPSPKFSHETLQECRLFNKKGELFIWRDGDGSFKARLIEDDKSAPEEEKPDDFFDEPQVLWGTQIARLKDKNGDFYILADDNFTVVADGSEGLHHAFPMTKAEIESKFSNNPKELKRPLRLCVRHYLNYDEDGCAFVRLSRLMGIETKGE